MTCSHKLTSAELALRDLHLAQGYPYEQRIGTAAEVWASRRPLPPVLAAWAAEARKRLARVIN